MTTRSFLYGTWCIAVIGLCLFSGIFAWSPFAEGGQARTSGVGVRGPTHK